MPTQSRESPDEITEGKKLEIVRKDKPNSQAKGTNLPRGIRARKTSFPHNQYRTRVE